MGEITLKNGKVLTIDVSDLTVKEWRSFISPGGTQDEEDAVVAKCTGLKADEIKELKYQEFRLIVKVIVTKCREPLADPVLASASTSTE